ncbi:MAG: hypothetical protein U5L76_04075 [Patescibacteria group bacterium]|nr:hypothetical protein [Patescibacteria group bacterium]
MIDLNLDQIEKIKKEILDNFKICEIQQDILQVMEEKYNVLKNNIDIKKINYCIHKYIDSELDFKTEGMRGIGRASTFVPRLGACYRSQFYKLSQEDIDKIYIYIQDILLLGYLSYSFLMEEEPKFDNTMTKEKLSKEWITGIYASDPSEMRDKLQNTLANLAEKSITKLKDIFKKHNIKNGKLFSKDKLDLIIWWYVLAGFSLRLVESGRHKKMFNN